MPADRAVAARSRAPTRCAMSVQTLTCLPARPRTGCAYCSRRIEVREVLLKTRRQRRHLTVVCGLVRPYVARVQQLSRYSRTTGRNAEAERRLYSEFSARQAAIERRCHQCAGVWQAHALAHS